MNTINDINHVTTTEVTNVSSNEMNYDAATQLITTAQSSVFMSVFDPNKLPLMRVIEVFDALCFLVEAFPDHLILQSLTPQLSEQLASPQVVRQCQQFWESILLRTLTPLVGYLQAWDLVQDSLSVLQTARWSAQQCGDNGILREACQRVGFLWFSAS